MPRLPCSALKPGSVVLEDVRDPEGCLLVEAGRRLTEEDLQRLRTWGIAAVAVEGADAAAADDAETQRIRERFRHLDPGHPFVEALLAHCVARAHDERG